MGTGQPATPDKLPTGVKGLDDVLAGGLPRNRLYLVEGASGSGKTTLALQFLLEGIRRGDPVLYVVLAETQEESRQAAESHGWSFDGVTVLEMAQDGAAEAGEQYTVFHPSEVELDETTKVVLDEVERVKPVRVVLDSITGLRLLAQTAVRYRKQVLGLKRALARRGCTTLPVSRLPSPMWLPQRGYGAMFVMRPSMTGVTGVFAATYSLKASASRLRVAYV